MIQLRNSGTGAVIGTITTEQLDFLAGELEEETTTDQDYYIDANTIDMLEEAGADAQLLTLLRAAVGSGEGIDIAWSDE